MHKLSFIVLVGLLGLASLLMGCSSPTAGSNPTTSTTGPGSTTATTPSTEYTIGSFGPGGGIVFYDSMAVTGSMLSEVVNGTTVSCRYLECAPSDVGPNTGVYWTGNGETLLPVAYTVGSGGSDSTAILNSSFYPNLSPAYFCQQYTNNGKSDWFLPARDELNYIYTNLGAKQLGGFVNGGTYWSSTASPSTNYTYVNGVLTYFSNGGIWVQSLTGGTQSLTNGGPYIRPIRCF